MPDPYPASEFGGKTNRMGIQPHPHRPTEAEKLRSVYLTGDPLMKGDRAIQADMEAMQGLLPEAEQRAILEAQGKFEKGQVWEEIEQSGDS
jgi:hypothetical protein